MLTSLLSCYLIKKKKKPSNSLSLSNLNIHYSPSSFPHNLSKLHYTTANIIFLTGEFPRVGEDLEREREIEIILQDLDITIHHTDTGVGDYVSSQPPPLTVANLGFDLILPWHGWRINADMDKFTSCSDVVREFKEPQLKYFS